MTLIKVKLKVDCTDNVSGHLYYVMNKDMFLLNLKVKTSLTNGYTGCDRWKFTGHKCNQIKLVLNILNQCLETI